MAENVKTTSIPTRHRSRLMWVFSMVVSNFRERTSQRGLSNCEIFRSIFTRGVKRSTDAGSEPRRSRPELPVV